MGHPADGEEWGLEQITIAHALADTRQIPWSNINTTVGDLDRLGIPRGYVTGNFSEAQKRQWHTQREQIMIRKLRESGRNAEHILLVCGFEHMEGSPICYGKVMSR
jgi:hypothetical protein